MWLETMFEASDAAFPSYRKRKGFEKCSEKTKRRRIEASKGSISEEKTVLFKNLRTLDQKTAICIVEKGLLSGSRPELKMQKAEAGY